MPRVRPLTAELRQQEQEKKSNEVLARALRRHRADTRIPDKELAKALGVGTTSLCRWKNDPSHMTLENARRLAHKCKMTPDEWLALGGYKVPKTYLSSLDAQDPA